MKFWKSILSASYAIAVVAGVLFGAYAIGVSSKTLSCVEKVQDVRYNRDVANREAAVDRDDALWRLVNLRNVDTEASRKAVNDFNKAHAELVETRAKNPVANPDRICD